MSSLTDRETNDIYKIFVQPKERFTLQKSREWYNEEMAFILNEIECAKNNNQVAIVMTHFPPEQSIIHLTQKYKGYFSLWLHGHTHYTSSSLVGDTTLIMSNQYGYTQLGRKDGNFCTDCVIESNGPVGKIRMLSNIQHQILEKEKIEKEEREARNLIYKPPPPPPSKK